MLERSLFQLSDAIELIFATPLDSSHWFGYYNLCPFNLNNDLLLSHRVSFDGRDINSNDRAEIGYYNINDGSWNNLGTTAAFNWQQGAMLQWLGPNFLDKVIYNDYEHGHYVCRIVDIKNGLRRTLNWPIYSLTPDGKTSITLQFQRSYWCRAYSYENISNKKWNVEVPNGDGIFSISLESGKVRRIISLKSIIEYQKDISFTKASHWLEHIMLNPSGNRFVFYHRFSDQENNFKTRIFSSNIDGGNLFLLPNWKQNGYSHLTWKNNEDFLLFVSTRLAVGKAYDVITLKSSLGKFFRHNYRRFLAPLIPSNLRETVVSNSYYNLYKDQNGLMKEYKNNLLSKDGHPNYTKNGLFILTDTYADEDGFRNLLLFNTLNNKVLLLGRFYSPFNNFRYRCDLHPRFSRDDKMIIIDTAHSGKHQIMVLKINWNYVLTQLNCENH